jgi:hypothetical protein
MLVGFERWQIVGFRLPGALAPSVRLSVALLAGGGASTQACASVS